MRVLGASRGSYVGQVRFGPVRFQNIMEQLMPRVCTDAKQLVATERWHRGEKVQRSGSNFERSAGSAVEKRRLMNAPNIGSATVPRLENEITAVRRPVAAAFGGSAAPSRKYWVQVRAIAGNLPQGSRTGLGVEY